MPVLFLCSTIKMHKMPILETEFKMEKIKISNRRYLGSKTRLLPFIENIVNENCHDCKSFFDVFGGTGVVGAHFNSRFQIIENDLLLSNYYAFEAFMGREKIDESKLYWLIDSFNSSNDFDSNYYSENFGNTYLSVHNMKKLGHIRDGIDVLLKDGTINNREFAYMITALIYAIDKIANTVGHYDAYRKNGDLDKELNIKPLEIFADECNSSNLIYNEDSNELAKNIKADIAYLDPPYNSRQYSDAYHFLENVALNTKPEVYGVAKKMDRGNLKSKFNSKSAGAAFEDLVQNLDARYILVSYNNTGEKGNARSNAKISDGEIINSLSKRGKVSVFEKDFSAFTTGKTNLENHKERVFLCEVGVFEESSKREFDKGFTAKDIQSPLNYTGGKYRLLPQLKAKFPDDIEIFYDIFCGGANVGSNVCYKKIICIDNNMKVIELLNYIQNQKYFALLEMLQEKIREYGLSDTMTFGYEYYGSDSSSGVGNYNKKAQLKLRNDYNNGGCNDNLLLLLLIIYSFNNQIRFNKNNEYNLPVGKRDLNKMLRKKLKGFMDNIQTKDITFICNDYKKIDIGEINPQKTFFYMDPPYSLGTASYNENNQWQEIDDLKLFEFIDRCNKAGIRFALSNVIEHKGRINDNLLKWCISNNYNINYLTYNYQNSSYHANHRNTETKEVLITNY